MKFTKRTKQLILASIALLLVVANMTFLPKVFAGTLTKNSVMLYNMQAGGSGQVAFAFTPVTTGATSATLTFTGWTGGTAGSVNAAQSISTTGCTSIFTGATALPGSITAAGNAGTGVITISSIGAYSAATTYCAILTSATAVTTPTTTGVYQVPIVLGSDSGTAAVDVITSDQISVTASINPSFTLSLSGTSDAFTATLASGSIGTTTGITATVNTNAKTGWYLWGSDSNVGLKSTVQSYTVASTTPGTTATLSAGSEGYVTALPTASLSQGTGAGTATIATAFSSTASGQGSGLNGTPAVLVSSTGTANTATALIKEYATIKSTTPSATDYADTVTVVGAGSF